MDTLNKDINSVKTIVKVPNPVQRFGIDLTAGNVIGSASRSLSSYEENRTILTRMFTKESLAGNKTISFEFASRVPHPARNGGDEELLTTNLLQEANIESYGGEIKVRKAYQEFPLNQEGKNRALSYFPTLKSQIEEIYEKGTEQVLNILDPVIILNKASMPVVLQIRESLSLSSSADKAGNELKYNIKRRGEEGAIVYARVETPTNTRTGATTVLRDYVVFHKTDVNVVPEGKTYGHQFIMHELEPDTEYNSVSDNGIFIYGKDKAQVLNSYSFSESEETSNESYAQELEESMKSGLTK